MSASSKIKELKSGSMENLADWEVRAINEAEQAKDTLSWGEIDVVYEIHSRHKSL